MSPVVEKALEQNEEVQAPTYDRMARIYDVHFSVDPVTKDGVFVLTLGDQKIGNTIFANPAIYKAYGFVFNLRPDINTAAGAIWNNDFVWDPPIPSYISNVCIGPTVIVFHDDVTAGDKPHATFKFQVFLNGEIYTSKDPIIINKVPPV